MEKVVDYAIEKNKIDIFFKEITSMERFEYLVDELTYVSSPQKYYWDIVNSLFIRINEYLQFKKIYIDCIAYYTHRVHSYPFCHFYIF